MGKQGYETKVGNQLDTCMIFRNRMRAVQWVDGRPFFEICDPDDEPGLPVFSARINPELDIDVDDFDLQHVSARTPLPGFSF